MKKLKLREHFKRMPEVEWKKYKWQKANRIKTLEQLSETVVLTEKQKKEIKETMEKTKRKISIFPEYILLVDPEKPLEDPLGKGIIPTKEFDKTADGETSDPYALHKEECNIFEDETTGITHKYPHIPRFSLTDSCLYGCQHCYEAGHVPQLGGKRKKAKTLEQRLEAIVDYAKTHPKIYDMVLSGGDPLMLPDVHIEKVLKELSEVKNLKALRFCTYSVIKSPSRISNKLLTILDSFSRRFTINFMLDMIHPKEITERTKETVRELMKVGVRCFSQTPLLKEINIFKDAEKSRALLKKFLGKITDARVTPYYFIVKMALPGTTHLALPMEKIQEIFKPFLQHGGEVPGTALTFKLLAAAPEQKVFIYPETKFHYDEDKKGYLIDIGEKEVFYPYEDPATLS